MTQINLFFLLNIFLVVRLFTQWSDSRVGGIKKNLILALLELILLSPLFSSWTLVGLILLIIVLYHTIQVITEKKMPNLFWGRLIQFLSLLFLTSTLLGFSENVLEFNKSFLRGLNWILENNLFTRTIKPADIKSLQLYIFGLLITLMEINHIIRAILQGIKASPMKKQKGKSLKGKKQNKEDKEELKRGKIIGAVERVLFFFFVLTGNYSSIGFILAAKGITRFKELKDKDFAEYVLIGTLLSSSLSIFCAEGIKRLILFL